MMKKMDKKFRKGAASFYIVAFATLILVVVAASFAIVIISAISRTSNDDLSQSAYDAALAGVEDAKLAYANYKACIQKSPTYTDALTSGNGVNCQDIVYFMKHPDCDMVAHILGRIGKREKGEVLVQETKTSSGSSNNINEAYTCVMIKTSLSDYRASLSASNTYQVVKVNLGGGVRASDIDMVRLNWYSNREGAIFNYTNFLATTQRVTFQSLKSVKVATPPTITASLIQTANFFKLEELNGKSSGNQTDRATMYFVPTDSRSAARTSVSNNYVGIYNGNINRITAAQIASTNDHMKDLPFVAFCDPNNTSDEFACSVEMKLPKPIGGDRSDETFMFVVSLPYGQPDTDFSLEFICADGNPCSTQTNPDGSSSSSDIAMLEGAQVVIDSTGRANDLHRRVELRLESTDTAFAYPMFAIQVFGEKTGSTAPLKKDLTVTQEYNF